VPGLGFSVGSIERRPHPVGVDHGESATPAIGPGKMSGITVTVSEFDPATVDFDTRSRSAAARASWCLPMPASAPAPGSTVEAERRWWPRWKAVVYVKGSVGIPADKPILSADSKFTYSQANGLDILNTLERWTSARS
jgi:hypothetical protein